jgi:hypothetical protein
MLKKFYLVLLVILLFSSRAFSYQEVVRVPDGGALKGKVTVKGKIPEDEIITVSKYADYCGNTLPGEKFVVNQKGEVKNAVVFLDGIQKGKPVPDEPVVILIENCSLKPHVSVGSIGRDIRLTNIDPMPYNIRFFMGESLKHLYELTKEKPVDEKAIRYDEAGVFSIESDSHPWIKGYLYSLSHPYIAVTDSEGNFEITKVPPGTYKLRVWHEALGEKSEDLTLPPGGSVEVIIEFGN